MGWATPTVSIKQTKTLNFIIRLFIQKKTICDRTAVLDDWTPFQSCHSNLEVFNQVKSIYFQIIKKIETKQKCWHHLPLSIEQKTNKQKPFLSDLDMNFSMVIDKTICIVERHTILNPKNNTNKHWSSFWPRLRNLQTKNTKQNAPKICHLLNPLNISWFWDHAIIIDQQLHAAIHSNNNLIKCCWYLMCY